MERNARAVKEGRNKARLHWIVLALIGGDTFTVTICKARGGILKFALRMGLDEKHQEGQMHTRSTSWLAGGRGVK